MITVTALYLYPIKGCGGMSVKSYEVGRRGPLYDRQWMLVDENGKFVTQRTLPALCQVRPYLLNQKISLTTTRGESTFFEWSQTGDHLGEEKSHGPSLTVQIWQSQCQAFEVSPQISQWFSDLFSRPLRLVQMEDQSVRQVKSEYGQEEISFVDGHPFMIASEESLNDLNRRLSQALPMNRFRPNIVVKGVGKPYAEDEWRRFRVGSLQMRKSKLCTRCQVTMTDQNTGVVEKEPLQTLAGYRLQKSGICFGINAIHENFAQVKVGDNLVLA